MAWTLGPPAAGGGGGASVGTLPELLTRALQWPPDDQAPFFVSVHVTSKGTPLRAGQVGAPVVIRRGIAGRPCWTYAEAAQRIAFGVSRQRDVYFCTATCTQWEQKASNDGSYSWRQTKRDGPAWSKKCLYVDVDVKPGAYESYDAARAAFDQIVRQIGLPAASFIVLSGSGGFHAYWTFTEAIPIPRWQAMANKLAAALHACGFTGDLGITVDATRILRVPGTYNHKTATPAPVQQQGASGPDYDPAHLEQILAPWPEHRGPKTSAPKPPPVMPSAFQGAGIDPAFGNSRVNPGAMSVVTDRIEDVAQVCPFIANTLATGGAGHWEPLWKETINVALHVVDARGVAHRLSQGHAQYDPAATDAKFDQQFHVKQSRPGGLGFPQCHTLHQQGARECPACPHFKDAKSPFNFVIRRVLRNAHVSLPVVKADGASLPEPYIRNSLGLITINDQPICQYAMSDAELVTLQDGTLALRLDAAGPNLNRRIEVPAEVLTDKRKFAVVLARQHFVVGIRVVPQVMDFMTALVTFLQQISDTAVSVPPFGWAGDRFVTADTSYGVDGASKPNIQINAEDRHLLDHYVTKGSLAQWRSVARLVTDMRRPDHNVVLAAAFASPLVPLSGTTDALWLSVWSPDSGVGKSTTTQIMHTVWGSLEHRMIGTRATYNAVAHRLATMRHYPVGWDDLRIDEESVRQTVLQVASGQDKNRLNANITERRVGTWRSLLVSNSNVSIHDNCDDAGTAAEILRIFEYRMGPLAVDLSGSEAERRLSLLNSNYGLAGEIYAMWLGAHRAVAERLMQAVRRRFEADCNSKDSSERFWLRTMSAIYTGAVIARHLALVDFSRTDLIRMRLFLAAKLVELRERRLGSHSDLNLASVVRLIQNFLHQHHRSGTIHYDPATGLPKIIEPLPHGVSIIIEKRGDVWRISRSAFQGWLKRNHPKGHSLHGILDVLRRHGAREARDVLGTGMASATPPVQLIVIDCALPPFQNQL